MFLPNRQCLYIERKLSVMANEVLNRRNNELMNDVNDPFFDNLARR